MLFTDEDLFGPQAQQLDVFELLAEIEASAPTGDQEVPVPSHNVGDGVRYHGTEQQWHGDGYIVATEPHNRFTVRVRVAEQWQTIRHAPITSVSPLTATTPGVDYGDVPGDLDLFGAGQLVLAEV
jgi:hypothetical protein